MLTTGNCAEPVIIIGDVDRTSCTPEPIAADDRSVSQSNDRRMLLLFNTVPTRTYFDDDGLTNVMLPKLSQYTGRPNWAGDVISVPSQAVLMTILPAVERAAAVLPGVASVIIAIGA